jgi:hypothetical protein
VTVKGEEEIDEIVEQRKKMMTLAMLTKTDESISKEEKRWKKLSMAVDSGARENVIDAGEEVPNYLVQENWASKIGVNHASATGEEIPNLGEVTLPMATMEGAKRKMKL